MKVLLVNEQRMLCTTATTAAYLMSEGVHIGLTDKEWRRAIKAMKRLGLSFPEDEDPSMDGVWEAIVAGWAYEFYPGKPVKRVTELFRVEEKEVDYSEEVDLFLEEMMIMGFLVDEPDEDDGWVGGWDTEEYLPINPMDMAMYNKMMMRLSAHLN